MDRQVIYPGQVPIETDLLKTNQNVMVGLAKLSQAIFGTGNIAVGFGTSQTVVPSLAVLVAPGEIYSQQNLEASAISSLPQDLAHSILKQGISLDPLTLPVTAPGAAGFSVNYLVQAGYQDTDGGSTVLPYYNASNPAIAYSGPANSGAAQPTVRQGSVVVSLKAGTAATTGTQTTPAPDAGKVGLYVVTVANGANTVLNANISPYPNAPILAMPVTSGRLIGVRLIGTTQIYNATVGTNFVIATPVGGGGGGGGTQATGAGQSAVGGGGGGGGWARKRINSGFNGVLVTIGASGTSGAGVAGGAGGATAFGSLVSATGGQGGTVGTPSPAGTTVATGIGPPGEGSGGDINFRGGQGNYGIIMATPTSGKGGFSYGGEGGSWASGYQSGGNATGFGAGGGGASADASKGIATGGGAGQGICIIEEFA